MSHQPRTHLAIDARLVGHPVHLADGTALVRLETTKDMAADDRSLVHGGFVFGLADYAAMLAVNEPTVVLAAAHLTFLRPVVVGETLEAEATVGAHDGKRRSVRVVVRRHGEPVLEGELTCAVPAQHVLDRAPRGGSR